jgi:mannosylglycerate hydrolase
MECFRHDLLVAAGTGAPSVGMATAAETGAMVGPAAAGPGEDDALAQVHGLEGGGLSVDGEGVVLSSLRRRGDWLELRLACQHPSPITATVSGGLVAARAADLLGRPGPDLPITGGALRLDLRAWEIRTVQLRRDPETRD